MGATIARGSEASDRTTAAMVGREFRRAREALGLTQEEAAERCGVSIGALRRWESGAGMSSAWATVTDAMESLGVRVTLRRA